MLEASYHGKAKTSVKCAMILWEETIKAERGGL
jgi:hypothetical protein